MNDPQFDAGPLPKETTPAPTPFDAEVAPVPPPERQGRGCFFYGCIVAIVLGVLGLIFVAALVYLGYYYYSQMINQWTATAPAPLPAAKLSADEQKDLDDRFAAFKKALDDGEAAEITLNGDELNALINENPDIKGKVYVTIKGDKVSGQLSLPLDPLGLPLTKGRYFNGSGTFNVSLEDGELVVYARELEANGKSLPEEAKAQLAKENLAKSFMDNPDTYKTIRKFESLKIKDGKVVIKARAKHKESFDEDEKDKDKDTEKGKGDEPEKDGAPPADRPQSKEKPGPSDQPSGDKEDAPKEAEPKTGEAPGDENGAPAKDEPAKDKGPQPKEEPVRKGEPETSLSGTRG